MGGRPDAPQPDAVDVGEWAHGWQYYASTAREQYVLQHEVRPASDASRRAMMLSQAGPSASRWLTALPTSAGATLEPIRVQVALRRRLRWPLPVGAGACSGRSCRRRLDALGDHMASCHLSGRLGRRSKPLERTWARVFREAGARVAENVYLRDTTLQGIRPNDGRRLEIVATGLPMHRGAPPRLRRHHGEPLARRWRPLALCGRDRRRCHPARRG